MWVKILDFLICLFAVSVVVCAVVDLVMRFIRR